MRIKRTPATGVVRKPAQAALKNAQATLSRANETSRVEPTKENLEANRQAFKALVSLQRSVWGVASAGKMMGRAEANAFMDRLILEENRFFQPGVAYDEKTGMTLDGCPLDPVTHAALETPRSWSAPSKESLHLNLCALALSGQADAQRLLSPDPAKPSLALARVLDVLEKKISSYERFDHAHPGFGGFLPWYRVTADGIAPTAGWEDRVPGLDNGQFAWGLKLVAHTLRAVGKTELADRYQAHFDKLARNAVGIFYDPAAKKVRAEAGLVKGNAVPVADNQYENRQPKHFLDDPYEGLLMCHFMDLYGDWSAHPDGRDAVFATPRREKATYLTLEEGKPITLVRGNWMSGHEQWSNFVLPFLDSPKLRALFENGERARTAWAAEMGEAGLAASVTAPNDEYVSARGVPVYGVAKETIDDRPVFAPYSAASLALVRNGGKEAFATWLRQMSEVPGMRGPLGLAESFERSGAVTALTTWDGKALPMLGWLGGVGDELAQVLKEEGRYDPFVKRVEADLVRFDGEIAGTDQPLRAPTVQPVGRGY